MRVPNIRAFYPSTIKNSSLEVRGGEPLRGVYTSPLDLSFVLIPKTIMVLAGNQNLSCS